MSLSSTDIAKAVSRRLHLFYGGQCRLIALLSRRRLAAVAALGERVATRYT